MVNQEIKIAFIHNVYDRYRTLLDTILIEKKYFPNSDVYVLHNRTDINIDLYKDISNIYFNYFKDEAHKIGCTNGCIIGFKEAIKKDYDVIIFSHDDVFINVDYIDIVKDNIEKIINGVDFICRNPKNWGDNYYMMEVFYLNGIYAKNLFKDLKPLTNETELPKDYRGSYSPEVFLFDTLKNNNNNIVYIYTQGDSDYNELLGSLMGYHHKNIGKRAWKDGE